MTITVHMHGNLRRFVPGGAPRTEVEVAPGTTVETLLDALGAGADIWLVAVNGTTVAREHRLAPGDRLDCFEPVAAG